LDSPFHLSFLAGQATPRPLFYHPKPHVADLVWNMDSFSNK
jgi:hypothetical protein